MRMLTTSIAAFAALSLAGSAFAQQPTPAGVTRRNFSPADPDHGASVTGRAPEPAARTLVRTLTGALGFAGGAAIGVGVANASGPHHCGCDDPGLNEALTGIIIGGVVGAGIGAAIPTMGTECAAHGRFLRALGGSALGFAAGFLLPPFGPLILSPVGSAIALADC